jgi:Flp pilus assembly protein TadG
VKPLYPGKGTKSEHGQVWVLFGGAIAVLMVFVGLAIDYGRAYVAKTTLAKAVDAAALEGMKNINLGTGSSLPNCSTTSGAGAAALEAFNVNFNSVPNLSVTTPTPSICFSLDTNNNTIITVNATASINTYFIRIADLFGSGGNFNTLSVGASAQAQRNPLIMSLILDVSFSMTKNGGSGALPGAVENFIADFDPGDNDTVDWVSVVTFGTYANVNLDNTQPLKNPVDNVMATNFWPNNITNYTNSMQGLTLGQNRLLAKVLTPNTIRAAVFFTDGWPNILQDNFTCGGAKTAVSLLYCGCDPGDEVLAGVQCSATASQTTFFDPTSCASNNSCNAPNSGCGSGTGKNPTLFPDQQTGASESLTNVSYCGGTAPGGQQLASDAMYRAVKVAQSMQANGIYVYSIGMGSAITGQASAEEFLREVANDPNAATYNPNLPQGEAVFASTSTQLSQVFQVIASKILLRLSK